MDEKQRYKRRREFSEYDKVLQSLDYDNNHDLATHLLAAAKHKRSQNPSQRTKRARTTHETAAITDPWTAWPLPASDVPRTLPVPSSSAINAENHLSSALHSEIEATITRIARERIQSHNRKVSANENPPYHVTREISSRVLGKLEKLLLALGRVKYQIHSQRDQKRKRLLKSQWDEVVGLAGISGCIDSVDTMKRVTERCNELFEEEIRWDAQEK
jgi:hypothetical protein